MRSARVTTWRGVLVLVSIVCACVSVRFVSVCEQEAQKPQEPKYPLGECPLVTPPQCSVFTPVS